MVSYLIHPEIMAQEAVCYLLGPLGMILIESLSLKKMWLIEKQLVSHPGKFLGINWSRMERLKYNVLVKKKGGNHHRKKSSHLPQNNFIFM